MDSTTAPAATPMMAITTMSSTRVNPCRALPRAARRLASSARWGVSTATEPAGRESASALPVADIGVISLAPFLAVGAEGPDVELAAVGAAAAVLVGVAPGVFGQATDIAALAIAFRPRQIGGRRRQGLQALLVRREGQVVEAIGLHRLLQHRDVGPRLADHGLVLAGQDADGDYRRQQADDDDDHH